MVMKMLIRALTPLSPFSISYLRKKVILTVKQARLGLYEISLENSKFCLAQLIEQLVKWVQKSGKKLV